MMMMKDVITFLEHSVDSSSVVS